ncbi:hypothetical protein LWM68_15680 [Niabella sp. W65]|nr:hypothetical protein [Niabella sp. W65]MCH7364068.1 hypothetical protein [Niabella sp. W65]ULT39948.1 hypothetical protein KRR40_34505 [Niabella sp. I65]
MKKRIKSKKQLIAIVEKNLAKTIDKLFRKLHKRAKTKSGDIDPIQIMELEAISEQLVSLIAEQVWQNIES